MATVTVRHLDEATKKALQHRAVRHGVSMEQEIRMILKSAVLHQRHAAATDEEPGRNWYDSVRDLVENHGGFDVELPPRNQMMREPPTFE